VDVRAQPAVALRVGVHAGVGAQPPRASRAAGARRDRSAIHGGGFQALFGRAIDWEGRGPPPRAETTEPRCLRGSLHAHDRAPRPTAAGGGGAAGAHGGALGGHADVVGNGGEECGGVESLSRRAGGPRHFQGPAGVGGGGQDSHCPRPSHCQSAVLHASARLHQLRVRWLYARCPSCGSEGVRSVVGSGTGSTKKENEILACMGPLATHAESFHWSAGTRCRPCARRTDA
jgi:hypothetical protein